VHRGMTPVHRFRRWRPISLWTASRSHAAVVRSRPCDRIGSDQLLRGARLHQFMCVARVVRGDAGLTRPPISAVSWAHRCWLQIRGRRGLNRHPCR